MCWSSARRQDAFASRMSSFRVFRPPHRSVLWTVGICEEFSLGSQSGMNTGVAPKDRS